MSVLDKLEFAKKIPEVTKPRWEKKTPLELVKERLASEIDIQISLAKDPKFKVVTSQKKHGTGKVVKLERTPRSWVRIEGDTAFIAPRYANKVLNIGGRKGAFIKSKPDEVVDTLNILKKWAASSESDATLRKAALSAKRGPRKSA